MDKRLIAYAAQLFGVEADHIMNPNRRDKATVTARYALAWALLRTRPLWTRQQIAAAIGLGDRKTVYTADRRAEDLRQLDRTYRAKLDRLLLVAGREEEIPPPPPQHQAATVARKEARPPFQPTPADIWHVRLQGGDYIQARTA